MKRFLMGLVLCAAVCVRADDARDVDDLATVQKQLATYFTLNESFFSIQRDPITDTLIPELLKTQKADGSWAMIDYKDKNRGNWATLRQLARTRQLAAAWQKSKGDHTLRDAAERGLSYWVTHDFQNPNWWYQSIGTPLHICETVILLDNEIPDEIRTGMQKILDRSKVGMTGQNKVWVAGIHAMKGIIAGKPEMVKKGKDTIAEEIVIAPRGKEGLQADFSFHQHGPMLQFGNYGLSFFADGVKWASALRGTVYDFSAEKTKILRDYYNEGLRWTLWKSTMDINSCARQIGPGEPVDKYKAVIGNALCLPGIDTSPLSKPLDTPKGNRYYYCSDFMVQRGSAMMTTVKMSSNRVIGCETVNLENLKGKYGGDGATFFYLNGMEYAEIMPLMDWRKIPGTTALQDKANLRCDGKIRNKSDFVGGVSNGGYGVCAMDLNVPGLKAKKSYFTFNNSMIAIGSGITSESDAPVFTTIDQCKFLDKPIINEAGDVFQHGDIRYCAKDSRLMIECREIDGDWGDVIGALKPMPAKGKRFLLGLDHGVKPKNDEYYYKVLCSTSQSAMKSMRLTTSHPDIHAAGDRGAMMAVFFAAGSFTDAPDTYVVDCPMILMIVRNAENLALKSIHYADPTGKLKDATLTLPNGKVITLPFDQVNKGATSVVNL